MDKVGRIIHEYAFSKKFTQLKKLLYETARLQIHSAQKKSKMSFETEIRRRKLQWLNIRFMSIL